MSKFIKRIGTTASKFMVELYFSKVELSLIQPCQIAIILKRGDHVMETKKPVPLEKGIAKFDEKLVIPATLYHDKKKESYIKKEASITVNVITPKVTRLAGVAKVELSQFPNKNVTEQEVVQGIEKCFDKNAKVHFKIRMIKVSDIIPDRKSHRKMDKGTRKESKDENEDEREHSEGSLPSKISGDPSGMQDFSDGSSIPDLSRFENNIRSQTGQFDLGKAKSPDFRIDESLDEDDLGAKARSRTVDNTKFARGHIFEDKKEQKNFIDVALSEITTAADAGNHQQKLLELEVKVKNYQRENKELYNKIREDNEEYLNLNQDYEDIKLKYERMKREYDSLVNERNLEKTGSYGSDKKGESELKMYKDKVAELEKEVHDLTRERNEANERADELQQATQDLLLKIESYKNSEKKHTRDNSDSVEQYVVKINEFNQKLKDAEKKMKDMADEHKKVLEKKKMEIEGIEAEKRMFQQSIEEKEERITDLEKQLVFQAKEMDLMKKLNNGMTKSKEENAQQTLPQIEQMEKKQKALEDTYKKRIDELTKQNGELKKELEQVKSKLSTSQFDTDNELAKLSIENETLKRSMKEANAKLLNVKYDNKEVEEMRRKLVRLEADKEKLDSELAKAKMGWASADIEKEEAKSKLKAKEESTKGVQERMEIMEAEVVRLRTRIAELMNAVMEFGEMELLDKIENIIT